MVTSSLARTTLYIWLKAFCILRSRAHLSVHEYRSSSQRAESLSKSSSRCLSVGRGAGLLSPVNCARHLLYSSIKVPAFLARALISLLMVPESLVPSYEIHADDGRTVKSGTNQVVSFLLSKYETSKDFELHSSQIRQCYLL